MRLAVEGILEGIGQVTLNLRDSFGFIFKGRADWRAVSVQIAAVGFDSLPIAIIINLISGCVLSLNAAEQFALTGANAYVGALVALATVREMGPIFTALAVGARAGTAISAEIANMGVTNQLDALKIMNVNPLRYLMVPRVLACIISLPLITILAEAIAILGGAVVAWQEAHIHFALYMNSVWMTLDLYDIEISLLKSLIFGIELAGIAVTVGLLTRGGARAVGLSTTQATVWTAITVIITDFFLTWMCFGTSLSD